MASAVSIIMLRYLIVDIIEQPFNPHQDAAPTDWTPFQHQMIHRMLRYDPLIPPPNFSPDMAAIVNQFITCRQWLLRTGADLPTTEDGYYLSCIRYGELNGLHSQNPIVSLTSADWELHRALHDIASDETLTYNLDAPHQREVRALSGAEADLRASLELNIELFKILWRKRLVLRLALMEIDKIISDVANGSL